MTQPEKVDFLLKGGTLVTMDGQRRVIENGAIAIRDGTIFKIGAAREVLPKVEAQKVLDVSNQVVTPGFINTHGHWAMTLFRGMVDDRPLEAWLSRVWKMELLFTSPQNVVAGAQLAMVEMIRSGTTCAADMYWQFRHSTEAACRANFRVVNGPTFAEIKGFGSRPLSTPRNAHEFIERYKDNPLVHLCVQVHATYTASQHLMEEARRIAAENNATFITHASESRAEVENVRKMYGKTPIEVLQSIGLLGERTLLAHCVHLSDEEIQLLAESGTSVAHCPSSNLKLSSGIARVAEMVKAGVNVTIGTDGPASNNDLDLLHEAQLAALVQKGVSGDPTVLPAEEVFAMMTINGARAIGAADRLGSLEAGKLADITVLDFNAPHLTPCYDIYSHLIYAAHASDVRHVFIHGKPVMEDRRLLTLDEEAIKEQVKHVAGRIKRSLKALGMSTL